MFLFGFSEQLIKGGIDSASSEDLQMMYVLSPSPQRPSVASLFTHLAVAFLRSGSLCVTMLDPQAHKGAMAQSTMRMISGFSFVLETSGRSSWKIYKFWEVNRVKHQKKRAHV